jgi:peptide/nickel transport system substrate-binding protein
VIVKRMAGSRTLVLLTCALLMVAGPVAGPVSSGPAADADTLVIGMGTDPINLDPPFLGSLTADSIFTSVFDRLLWRSEPNMRPVLWLAESLTRVDPLTWQVKLRRNVRFHNGRPLTAQAIKFSIERYGTLQGANRFYYSQAAINRVDVIDAQTANIVTREPFELMNYAAANSFYLVEPEMYGSTPIEQLAARPVGTGPYKFVEYRKDERVVLERNDQYWGEKPAFRRVIFRIIPEAAVRMAELEAGNLDLVEKMPIDKAAAITRMPNARALSMPSGRRVFLQAQRKAGTPLADRRVMKALNHAIDIDTIIQTLLGGMTKRMATFVNAPNADPGLAPYKYDVALARKMLSEAGFASGFEVNLYTSTGRLTRDVEVSQAIASYLNAVGVRARVQVLEWSVYVSRSRSCDLDGLFLRSEGPEFNDQGDLQGVSPEHVNVMACSQWANGAFKDGYSALRREPKPDRRRGLTLRLQKILYEDPPIVMLYNEPNLYGVSKRIEWTPRVDERVYASRVKKGAR